MKIEGTKESPTLEFDEVLGKLKIYGVSISIDPTHFWGTVIDKMKTYLEYPMDVELDINLEYFNTPAAVSILSLLRLIDKNAKKFTVIWHDDNDENMRETGEDLESMVNQNTKWIFEA